MRGLIICGSRNIFTVRCEEDGKAGTLSEMLECRIKGKVLKEAEGFYNPLAPGDWVTVEADSGHVGTGLITALEKRNNQYRRFNQKGGSPQLLAANVDLVLCVTSPAAPPFRPRFLDRAVLQADAEGIPPLIVCNKSDLGFDDIDVEERLEDFVRTGCQVIRVSAKTGEGLEELRSLVAGKCSVLAGQSGVGKSSLVNALFPRFSIKTGAINVKYDRGNHTTAMSLMAEVTVDGRLTRIIDTPGIRRFVPAGITPDDLILYMREFALLAGKCAYGFSCSHRIEPGCKIMEAVHAGVIHEDRYNSFVRIADELAGKRYVD
ncbi:MAG: ribosome small subunit-dependent GTPase A [Treponema sp.]|jgi:ribosome biogenesis GTPase|nr:ribosome small subunit-dependent GTPase A [Treponema sp.]